MTESPPEATASAELVIVSIEEVSPWIAVCVVRCTTGTLHTGMTLRGTSLTADLEYELVEIESRGLKADALTAPHTGKVLVSGVGTRLLQIGDTLAV
jgi:shikimate kinase